MDAQLRDIALARGGLLLPAEIAGLTAGERRSLIHLQPGVLVAGTQPKDTATLVRAVDLSVEGHAFAGLTALWIYGVVGAHAGVDVAVPDTRQLMLLPPARVRRLAPSLLMGVRPVDGHPVVALETAVVQSGEGLSSAELLVVVEDVLRRRLTTPGRLLGACRHGVKGASALRSCLDVVHDGDLEELKRRLRRALEAAGVVGLESEVPVRSSNGALAYLDLLHRRSGNAFELDGWATHSERGRFVADRRRDRWVRRELSILTTRIAADEVRRSLADVIEELLPLVHRPGSRTVRRPAA